MAKNDYRKGYSVSVDKSYWLFEAKDVYETDCGRKRSANDDSGPSQKKIKTEIVSSKNDDKEPIDCVVNADSAKKNMSNKNRCYECGSEVNGNKFIINELFDDIESLGSDYDGDEAVITDLFTDMESVASDFNYQDNNSDDETSFLPDFFNFFNDDSSEDDEDRVIITEIFDDIETITPGESANNQSCKNTVK